MHSGKYFKNALEKGDSLGQLRSIHSVSSFSFRFALYRLSREGWVDSKETSISLTKDGVSKAASVVRLHRLWELYLASALGFQGEKIHHNAEEMEHILTPDFEKRLTSLLSDPKEDPHHQPIPEKEGGG